jgi:hypothetical protein
MNQQFHTSIYHSWKDSRQREIGSTVLRSEVLFAYMEKGAGYLEVRDPEQLENPSYRKKVSQTAQNKGNRTSLDSDYLQVRVIDILTADNYVLTWSKSSRKEPLCFKLCRRKNKSSKSFFVSNRFPSVFFSCRQ